MRFTSARDYETILRINRELINEVIDVPVILYKVNQKLTNTNSYGESTSKIWYSGVRIPCLINRQNQETTADVNTVNVAQSAEFSFLRHECELREVYPEIGDIIDWDSRYYEINGFSEAQLMAGRTEYKHSIICNAHLTRKTNLQLEPPQQ